MGWRKRSFYIKGNKATRILILIKQNFLYQLEEAIKSKDKNKKEFLLEILETINKWLKILKEAKNVEI